MRLLPGRCDRLRVKIAFAFVRVGCAVSAYII